MDLNRQINLMEDAMNQKGNLEDVENMNLNITLAQNSYFILPNKLKYTYKDSFYINISVKG